MTEMLSIIDFVSSYPNKKTMYSYQAALLNFCEQILGITKRKGRKVTGDELKEFDEAMLVYLNNGKTQEDYFKDVQNFAVWLQYKPPKTADVSITALKEFFLTNGIEFSRMQQKLIRRAMPKGGARTIENELNEDTFRSILEHCDITGRALFMTLKGSGMRVDECLHIKLDEIDMESVPARITLRSEYTKTKKQRLVLFDREATNVLNEWLKVRDSYLKASVNKNMGLVRAGRAKEKNKKDMRIFPYSIGVANQMWNNAVNKAGLMEKDKGTGRNKFHIHQTRKFFLSMLKLSCPEEVAEGLAGHSGGYLEEAYRRIPLKKVIEHFLKHQRQLYLYTPKEDIEKLETEFNFKHQKLEGEFNAKAAATEDMVKKFAMENARQQMNFEKQLSEKDEQIKNLTQMHDTLQLRVETTIEQAVRNRINTIRDMYAEKTQDEKDKEIKTLTEMVLTANQEANEQKSNYAELKEKITGLEKKLGKKAA